MLQYKNNKLYFDDIELETIAKQIIKPQGFKERFASKICKFILSAKNAAISRFILAKRTTPFYLYSENQFLQNFNILNNLLKSNLDGLCEHLVCFSVKSCSNISVLKLLRENGSGMDVVSGGELTRTVMAKTEPQKIVFAGVGKTKDEIILAIEAGILQINAESFEEIVFINKIASEIKKIANICVRLNPDIDAKTHSNITTGKKDNKFGISIDEAYEKLDTILKSCKNVNLIGLSTHIGSQIVDQKPLEEVFFKLADAFCHFCQLGYTLKTIDFGGGLGICYNNEEILSPEKYIQSIALACKKIHNTVAISPKVIIEPGRFIAANAGILVSKVLYLKQTNTKNFIIVDAAMNDLLRPALYSGYHKMYSATINQGTTITADVVGPICESSCCFIKNETYNASFNNGDLVVFANCGAYGFSMSSRYNTRPMIAEYLLCKNGKIKTITKAEKYENLLKNEF